MNKNNPLEDLQEIRKMMEDSTKFLSLSGLSGIFAGLSAMGGAIWAWLEVKKFISLEGHYFFSGNLESKMQDLEMKLYLIAVLVLVCALGFGIFFTWLKAKKNQQNILSPLSLKLVRSLMVPLIFGGLFTVGLIYQNLSFMVPSATLIFYGLALLNASKYVHVDIKYLALCQMILGVIAIFYLHEPTSGIILWTLGFGVMHIIYGTIMYFKYDQKKA